MDGHLVCGHQRLWWYAEDKDVFATVCVSRALQETVMFYIYADGHMCSCTQGQDGLSIRHASVNVQRGVFLCPEDTRTVDQTSSKGGCLGTS